MCGFYAGVSATIYTAANTCCTDGQHYSADMNVFAKYSYPFSFLSLDDGIVHESGNAREQFDSDCIVSVADLSFERTSEVGLSQS